MNKILLILSLFSSLFLKDLDTPKLENKEDYELIEEEDDRNLKIIESIDNVELVMENEKYVVLINNKKINVNGLKPQIIIFKEKLYLFYISSQKLYYNTYDLEGNLAESMVKISDSIINDYHLISNNNDLYCGYTAFKLSDTDCYIKCITRDYTKNLSSSKSEELIGLCTNDDNVYAVVKKDAITEGIFGNGGITRSHVLVKLSSGLNILDYITIDYDGNINNFMLEDNYIYLFFNHEIHMYSLNLEAVNYKYIGNYLLTKVGKNGIIIVFLADKYQIYNAKSLVLLAEKAIDFNSDYLIDTGSYIYLQKDNKNYKYDLIDLTKSKVYDYFNVSFSLKYDDTLNDISSLYGPVEVVDKKYSEYYNRGVYGDYNITMIYQTSGGFVFERDYIERIPLEINFRDQMVYPLGYRITFNGEGYLDGNGIVSNYAINEEGVHEIVIIGANVENRFKIKISSSQFDFTDYTKKIFSNNLKPIDILKEESFTLYYKVTKDIKIKEINYEGANLENYEVINDKLILTFSGYYKAGYYNLFIDNIVYEDKINNNESFDNIMYLNEQYLVSVSENLFLLDSTSFDENCNFSFDLMGKDNQERLIEFELINNKGNYIFDFPMGNSKITFTNVADGNYELVCYIIYDSGKEKLESIKLFEYPVIIKNDCYYGEVRVNTRSDSYNKYTISMDKDFKSRSVATISYNKQVIYSKEEVVKENVIMYSIIGTIASFGLGIGLRYIVKRLKKKNGESLDVFE